MALAGKRTAAAGGADATVTTLAGIHGVIDAALVAAGWTATAMPAGTAWQPSTVLPPFTSTYAKGAVVTNAGNRYQCIKGGAASTSPTGPTGVGLAINEGTNQWRFLTKIGDPDVLYTSTGESGAELITMRIFAQTATTASINMVMYQYWDGTFGYNRIGPNANAVVQITFTAGNTHNYAVAADKDAFFGIFNDNTNNRRLIGGGRLIRLPTVNSTYFVSNATVTAGANKTFNFSSGNPIAAGYKLGDRVFVVSQQANAADPFDPTVPLYAAKITGLTTSSITIDVALETTSSGALIGADPMPLWYTNANTGSTLTTTNFLYTNYRFDQSLTNLFTSSTLEQGYTHNGTGRMLTAAFAEIDPSRTGRVGMGHSLFVNANNEACGIIPNYFWNPRTTDALWAIGRSSKESSNFDYVTFPASTASPSGQQRETVGPFAISGSAGYTIDYFPLNTSTAMNQIWIEAEVHDQISTTHAGKMIWAPIDRALAIPIVPNQGYPFQGQPSDGDGGFLMDTDGNVFAWALYMPNRDQQGRSLNLNENQYGNHAAEPLPFDSPEAVSGGTGSAFNSGFN